MKRHKKTSDEINDINEKLNDHETKHKKEDDAIKKNRTSIDNLSEHIEAEFKQMKEKQCNNEQVHQRLKDQLAHFQKSSDETHENIKQNIKVQYALPFMLCLYGFMHQSPSPFALLSLLNPVILCTLH